MEKRITCFVMRQNPVVAQMNEETFQSQSLVRNIVLFDMPHGSSAWSRQLLNDLVVSDLSDYILLCLSPDRIIPGAWALERLCEIADSTGTDCLYADYYDEKDGQLIPHPLIACQAGSLRNDFDFGKLLFIRSSAFIEAAQAIQQDWQYAALYALRLHLSEKGSLIHVNEFLYRAEEHDWRKSGDKIFDYVDPRNRVVQLEMEQVCTEYLKRIGAYLKPEFKTIDFSEESFPVEASVIIPVRNRVRTIEDAIRSVLNQQTNFPFNLIVIDNHSTDGTTEAIDRYQSDPRLIHLIPQRTDLGIGGCWNEGIHHPQCGKFAVQLDSDDLYSSESTLQQIVDAFYQQQCAMVVGTYRMTNFKLEEIPPGVIDHKEWTPENGRNNALRINGLGAPRAFYTPLIRRINFPNTSYGEDYAVGLRICREYQIGRIYDVLYLCRRWEDNSDAMLSREKMNQYNIYKDRIRTWELEARIQQNRQDL